MAEANLDPHTFTVVTPAHRVTRTFLGGDALIVRSAEVKAGLLWLDLIHEDDIAAEAKKLFGG